MKGFYFYKFFVNTFILGACAFLNSCTKDIGQSPLITAANTPGCDTVTYTYTTEVKNIVTTNCAGCHFAGSADGQLTDFLHLQAKALNGSLVGSLKGQGYTIMPPAGRLSECDIKGIENWVQAGATNN